ncbi:MAG: cadmium-translocating P-type ATPase, partial [Prevotella sp.]|nr:cadmium-translocating P-type ATPase [Prevotella sp.]
MEEEERSFWKPAISLVLLIVGIIMTYMHVGWFSDKWVMLVWYVVAYLPVGIDVIKEAIESAVKGDVFSEFMLMSVASIGAFAIGEYPEAVAVMLFYCIGETLQDMAVDKARDNIKSLVAFRPDKAMVVNGNTVVVRTPEDVKIGEVIEVKPGERVALDGELLNGDASFNTAALTGESVPQMIEKGGEVLAGMIAADSVVRLRVKRIAGESAVARILNMVEEASSRKAEAELFIRKFARVYTPAVIFLAVFTVVFPYFFAQVNSHMDYSFTKWFYRGLIFLVISCPCALVISIPLSYFAGIGAASKRGILFKGSNYLDAVKYIDTVVFDKTGTLTKGVFSVVKVDSKEPDFLETVAAIEKNSNHPIAKAIVAQSKGKDIAVKDVKDRPGNGLSAKVGDDNWLVGTLRQLDRKYISYPDELFDVPETIVACAKNKKFVGYILLADTVKDDAKQAIKDLRKLDIKHIEILSGDKQALVTKLADELGVDAGYGDLMPEVKVKHVEMLKNEERDLAFVGDGINDAPVIATSYVGIAMGGLGSDMAIETADIVIQNDQPSKVVTAIKIGRKTHRIVNQNIIFAIGVKILVMALGVFGIANLWEAVFADVGVALLAVLNAMRI